MAVQSSCDCKFQWYRDGTKRGKSPSVKGKYDGCVFIMKTDETARILGFQEARIWQVRTNHSSQWRPTISQRSLTKVRLMKLNFFFCIMSGSTSHQHTLSMVRARDAQIGLNLKTKDLILTSNQFWPRSGPDACQWILSTIRLALSTWIDALRLRNTHWTWHNWTPFESIKLVCALG